MIKAASLKYWIVETWQQWAKKRQDLFGIIDLLVLDGGILGIQVCSGGDYQAHVRKLMEDEAENTRAWLESGGRIQIWAWRQILAKRGGKAKKWVPKKSDKVIDDARLALKEGL